MVIQNRLGRKFPENLQKEGQHVTNPSKRSSGTSVQVKVKVLLSSAN